MSIGTYKGIPVIVDDRCNNKETDLYNVYPAYLLKEGAILYNDYVDLSEPFITEGEVFEEQTLTTTKKLNIIVDGCSFDGLSEYEDGPTDKELSDPLNWKGKTDKIQTFNITIMK
jgi:hypothetical protein